ncbi:ABC transporter permease subunit [Mesorhizobium sp. M0119]|uniref:ABC transporter permease subunit n=1 Tax=Mesorhizobium sp. M0119 TaxID=2956885 RepID=UPI0033377B3A
MLYKLGRMHILLAIPSIALLLTVFGIPIVLLFFTSLNAPEFTLSNYTAFFSQPANIRVLLQTIEISAVATAACVVIGYPTAYLIANASKRWRVVLIVLVVIPYLTSGLARTYAWVVILGDRGLINNLLMDLSLISSPLPLIYNRFAVYIGMVHIMLPMMILPLISVMVGIDKSLVTAARSLGARPFAAFWRVFLPLSLPGLRSGSLLVFVICLGFYITPAALGGLRDAMLSTFIAAQVQTSFNLARIATSAFIILAIATAILLMMGLDLSGKPTSASSSRRKLWLGRLPVLGRLKQFLGERLAPFRARRWSAQLYRSGGDGTWSRRAGYVFLVLVLFYLLFPEILVVTVSFSAESFLTFPPSALSLRWYRNFFTDQSWASAAWTSVEIGLVVGTIATIFGTLAAYGLSRMSARPRIVLNLLLLMPITIPVIVVGVATYTGLVNLGLTGTRLGVILAHTIGAIGYVVVIVSATLANFDRRLEDAAKSMRASPFATFMRVTLPLIRPGILGGAVFAFLHSFDEVVITSLVSGYAVRTLPLKMWENMRNELDPTIAAVASMLILLPLLWLLLIYLTWWRSRLTSRAATDPV